MDITPFFKATRHLENNFLVKFCGWWLGVVHPCEKLASWVWDENSSKESLPSKLLMRNFSQHIIKFTSERSLSQTFAVRREAGSYPVHSHCFCP
jgi:hypothetical protein